jgi:hypothetical protein
VELTTPFAHTTLAPPSAPGWELPGQELAALPSSGCIGCPDWTGPAAPWQGTAFPTAAVPNVGGLPRLDLRPLQV